MHCIACFFRLLFEIYNKCTSHACVCVPIFYYFFGITLIIIKNQENDKWASVGQTNYLDSIYENSWCRIY